MINSVNRPTHARYQFLYSFPAVTFSISRSTQNELKMSSGQNAVPVCCPGLKKEQSREQRTRQLSSGRVAYHQDTHELFGYCGASGQQHACLGHFAVVVGDGEEGFTTVVNAFKEYKIGTFV